MIKLLLGDATKLDLPDNSVDLIITHPPYLGVDAERYGGNESMQINSMNNSGKKMLKLLDKATSEMLRVLKPSGSIFIANGKTAFFDTHYFLNTANRKDVIYNGTIFQNSYADRDVFETAYLQEKVSSEVITQWHHFSKSPNIYYNHVYCKKYNNPVWDLDFSNMSNDIDKELSKKYHVYDVMNQELVERLVNMFSKKGHTVLDPFGGSALVAVVAQTLGRDGVSNDISPKQVECAKQRILLTLGEPYVE